MLKTTIKHHVSLETLADLSSSQPHSALCAGFHRERLGDWTLTFHCKSGQHKPLRQIQALVLQQAKPSLQGKTAVGTVWLTVPEASLSQLMDMETTVAFRERDLST